MNCFLYVYTKRFKYLYQGIFFIIIICTVKNACTFATCDQTNTNLWVLTQGTKKKKKEIQTDMYQKSYTIKFFREKSFEQFSGESGWANCRW